MAGTTCMSFTMTARSGPRRSSRRSQAKTARSGKRASSPTPRILTARTSPNGRYLAFMSAAPITGYDNIDATPAAKGARDEEVFLYDSATGSVRACPATRRGRDQKGCSIPTRPVKAWDWLPTGPRPGLDTGLRGTSRAGPRRPSPVRFSNPVTCLMKGVCTSTVPPTSYRLPTTAKRMFTSTSPRGSAAVRAPRVAAWR